MLYRYNSYIPSIEYGGFYRSLSLSYPLLVTDPAKLSEQEVSAIIARILQESGAVINVTDKTHIICGGGGGGGKIGNEAIKNVFNSLLVHLRLLNLHQMFN